MPGRTPLANAVDNQTASAAAASPWARSSTPPVRATRFSNEAWFASMWRSRSSKSKSTGNASPCSSKHCCRYRGRRVGRTWTRHASPSSEQKRFGQLVADAFVAFCLGFFQGRLLLCTLSTAVTAAIGTVFGAKPQLVRPRTHLQFGNDRRRVLLSSAESPNQIRWIFHPRQTSRGDGRSRCRTRRRDRAP